MERQSITLHIGSIRTILSILPLSGEPSVSIAPAKDCKQEVVLCLNPDRG